MRKYKLQVHRILYSKKTWLERSRLKNGDLAFSYFVEGKPQRLKKYLETVFA